MSDFQRDRRTCAWIYRMAAEGHPAIVKHAAPVLAWKAPLVNLRLLLERLGFDGDNADLGAAITAATPRDLSATDDDVAAFRNTVIAAFDELARRQAPPAPAFTEGPYR